MKIHLAFQPALRPVLPEVFAGADYHAQRQLFERIDSILVASKLDDLVVEMAIKHQNIDLTTFDSRQRTAFAKWSHIALRACIARILTGLAFRPFVARVADSPLLQWFMHLGAVDQVKVFSKSTAHRLENWISPENLSELNTRLLQLGVAPAAPIPPAADAPTQPAEAPSVLGNTIVADHAPAAPSSLVVPVVTVVTVVPPFGLAEFLNLNEAWLDTTAVQADIHHPTDWVLLRDAARTLALGLTCIREAGVLCRMPKAPEAFSSAMNSLCMAMAAQRRQKGAKKARKAIFRKMKNLLNTMVGHAQSHLEAFKLRRESHTALTEGQAAQIIRRMENVLEQVPAIKQQAQDRIIGGRKLLAGEKILSIYDKEVNIIIRGKANAEVEFGNRLDLVESRQGLILDAFLHRGNPADSKVVQPCVQRLQEAGLPVEKLGGDRGLHSADNEAMLKASGIQSYICPRDPAVLAKRLAEEPDFKESLKRRGGTEGRIGIFKNDMLGNPTLGRSYEARAQRVGWAVLAHNLWVLARMEQKAKPGEATVPTGPEEDELAFLGPQPPGLDQAA